MSRCGGTMQERDGARCCNYCGSLSVQDAIKFLKQPGTKFSGSDWKYGWPHKFYIEPVNPNAAVPCYTSSSSHRSDDTRADGTQPDEFWTCFAHGGEVRLGGQVDQTPKTCVCPREEATGSWSHYGRGSYQTLHFKFYNVHLHDATEEELKEFSELSEKIFGVRWSKDEKGLKYSAPPTRSFYGHQQAGEINAQGDANRTL